MNNYEEILRISIVLCLALGAASAQQRFETKRNSDKKSFVGRKNILLIVRLPLFPKFSV